LWQDPPTLHRVPRLLGWCSLALALTTSWGCSSKKKPLEPLTAPSWRIQLPVSGFGPATVALPLGASTPRPIAVVLHGAADRAEWQCGSFRGVLGGRMFIVCPQGKARPELGDRFGLGNPDETSAELRAALKALKARFEGHVAPGPILLVGYAEGGEHALEIARQEPGFFSRVALVAGSPSALSSTSASVFTKKGGKRLLFVCTSAECEGNAAMRALWVKRAGGSAKSVRHDVGPFLDAAFTTAIKGDFRWLLEGDSRFPPL
jgi:pimeloyl-ACP methyl ester carboxylesterase